jgi:acetolactate synthase-1/2/3 large subunit
MTTVGEALVHALEARGTEIVFGIPGVHTVELYRGLARSGIRHVTPRHEQGAGFMADGYARATGKPGVAFVITGPGMTNILTAMGQARADSIPMLVISGVNQRAVLGLGHGHLHELPDQRGLVAHVAVTSERVEEPAQLGPALDRAFAVFASDRPGPVHIEIPIDVMSLDANISATAPTPAPVAADPGQMDRAAALLKSARRPLILAGGGAKGAGAELAALATALGAPVVQTVNARGLMHGHELAVPASPSLMAIQSEIRAADCVIAVGTEFGRTDYDMYARGDAPWPQPLIRIDISAAQLARHPAEVAIRAHAAPAMQALTAALGNGTAAEGGAARAARLRAAAWDEIGPEMQGHVGILNAVRAALPGATIVGDSTQAVYAGNLYYDHDRAGGWFNAATGFGTLGYSIPAAIGAALGAPGQPVICLVGDGGAQFTLPELMTAAQDGAPVLFLVWNNHAYLEIATSMAAVGIEVIGCHPAPPDFASLAAAMTLPYAQVPQDATAIAETLAEMYRAGGPALIEIAAGRGKG